MYLPKSKYTVSTAKPGEYKLNGKTYIGPVITTYAGDIYAGNDIRNTRGTLEKINLQEFPEDGNEVYPVLPIKRVPTEAEYAEGYMIRYFCRDIRSSKVFEISKTSFESGKANPELTYYRLFKAEWYLSGTGAKDSNSRTISELEKQLPGIVSSKVLYNPEQFFRDSVK